ncbi:hypothetical protein TraAM80_04090 [Trypanosoma rangeli]|uniref:Uncharacterized protein n=1 Tax=Trypanosoma rangeli TaxID=5698 RepID=A0A422NLH5_TRYRA|nr:uncharacterized protein TraAM80_04090 [Trypanosoma rangeli]RNF06199.1 hypothetical protein TraAM80_04090 [Trypanosoma rangeli]|eukprot:RNF06199.1 hypothetical protein TraAM80_04090 [Trypanosoma rangeli]
MRLHPAPRWGSGKKRPSGASASPMVCPFICFYFSSPYAMQCAAVSAQAVPSPPSPKAPPNFLRAALATLAIFIRGTSFFFAILKRDFEFLNNSSAWVTR